jgi:large subunit ribosomal protein L9
MEVLLLTDVPGVGKKNDLLVVRNGYALNHLLPYRKALVVTPSVRRRYAEQIKHRALEREKEKTMQDSIFSSLSGKSLRILGKANKTGKLYAAITEKIIIDTLKTEHGIQLSEESVRLSEPIKTAGKHMVTIKFDTQTTTLPVEVVIDAETKKKEKVA